MISLSKRLQEVGDKSEGWLKAKNISDQYSAKKRPKAATIYAWMQEAASMRLGSTRGAGNRMEFHWSPQGGTPPTDDNPPPEGSSPNSDFRNSRNTLGNVRNDVPKEKSVENKGVEDNVRNFRNDSLTLESPPHTQKVKNESTTSELATPPHNVEIHSPNNAKLSLEGKTVPKVSLSTPNDSSNVDVASETDFRNDSRKGFLKLPKVPKVAETSPSGEADDSLLLLREVVDVMNQCTTVPDVENLYTSHSDETIEAAKELLAPDERETFEAIASPNANLSPTAATDAQLVTDAKRQGKTVQRYVGETMVWGVRCLARNVLVERLGLDRNGLLVEVQRLGENWAQPIGVGEKFLEEVND
jgi:hypothetical protein